MFAVFVDQQLGRFHVHAIVDGQLLDQLYIGFLLRRFRGAIANVNKTLANRLYTPRIDRDIWGLSEAEFTEMVLRKMKFTDHKYVDRSGKLRTVYKPHKSGIDKLMEMIRKEEEE